MSEKIDNRVFTNTYVTGYGRQNYLKINHLEDPLFTSFTFDIDFISSPLFYTIKKYREDYGHQDSETLSTEIQNALEEMYLKYISQDQGYDILPALSASILDGNKLGFGLQQNVYMDLPLYGATEYIYMVDKRNGGASQNDVRFDSNNFSDSANSYKLGDSVKEVINESDRLWAEKNMENNQSIIDECNKILGNGDSDDSDYEPGDPNVIMEHKENEERLKSMTNSLDTTTINVDGAKCTEQFLKNKVDECKKFLDEFEGFKRTIIDYINQEFANYQSRGVRIYNENPCYQKISNESWSIAKSGGTKDCGHYHGLEYYDQITRWFGKDFMYKYLLGKDNDSYYAKIRDLCVDFFTNLVKPMDKAFEDLEYDRLPTKGFLNTDKVIEKFKKEFEYFGFPKENINIGDILVFHDTDKYEGEKSGRKWVSVYRVNIVSPGYGLRGNPNIKINDPGETKWNAADVKFKFLMGAYCDMNTAFSYEDFSSQKVKDKQEEYIKYENALINIRGQLYGYDENGNVCDIHNASPNSAYGLYLEAKNRFENDDYSQAEKARTMAQSGYNEASDMISNYIGGDSDGDDDSNNYNSSVQTGGQQNAISRTDSIASSQTVLDMLGFISGMRKMTEQYPYIIQGVTGLDVAYNKHYGIKDPYLGSGEDKITLTCLESLDLRVSSMFNRYFNAVYDRQYRRERVPVNLRRFNCSIYVHDVRNFVSKSRDKNGDYNRLLELTDMYYSVIEFKFFDCEIVPEETGNIFNDISNEAPSDMKKTNFTFTYGNCVVNFVPQSEVSAH